MDQDKLIESFLKATGSIFIKNMGSGYKALKDEVNNFFNFNVKLYLEKTLKRISNVKTILHKSNPVNLYDIYVPLKVNITNQIFDSKALIDHLQTDNFYATIIGEAGSGKSTFIKDLFIKYIEYKIKIPMIIELRNVDFEKTTLEKHILDELTAEDVLPNNKILDRKLNDGSFAFFLDGFDEINSAKKKLLFVSLQSFINKFRKNNFIITSRPFSSIEMFTEFRNYHIMPLDSNDVPVFIKKQLDSDNNQADKIIETVTNLPKESPFREYIYNPLLLSLFILTYQTNSNIPTQKHIFYRRVIDALFITHDSLSKIGFEREYKCKLPQDKIEEILKRFSTITYFKNLITFDQIETNDTLSIVKSKLNIDFNNIDFVDDMRVSACLWIDIEGKFTFAHRSIQEYFTAAFITSSDPSSMELLYKKISFFLENKYSDHTNLLSLLKEMNETNYNQFFLSSLLKKLNLNIKTKTIADLKNTIFKLVVEFSVYNRKENAKNENKTTTVSLGIMYEYFHFIPEEYSAISKLHELFNLIRDETLTYSNTHKSFPINKHCKFTDHPKLIENILANSNIKKTTREINQIVIKCLKEIETNIKKSKRNNLDLINLL